ncbi:MAG: DUF2061 domain-containing protein [Pseudomonadota bacterium]
METPRRTLAKTLSWQLIGMLTMTALGYWQTGSLTVGASLALSASAMGVVMFFIHERAWARVRWGFHGTLAAQPERGAAHPAD